MGGRKGLQQHEEIASTASGTGSSLKHSTPTIDPATEWLRASGYASQASFFVFKFFLPVFVFSRNNFGRTPEEHSFFLGSSPPLFPSLPFRF